MVVVVYFFLGGSAPRCHTGGGEGAVWRWVMVSSVQPSRAPLCLCGSKTECLRTLGCGRDGVGGGEAAPETICGPDPGRGEENRPGLLQHSKLLIVR